MIQRDQNTGEYVATCDTCGRVIETKSDREALNQALSERTEPLGPMELMGIDPDRIYCYDCMAMNSYFK
ncbi:MAG: hypothetical protein M0Z65_12300 [Firmicutes bacterium]|uniref:Uncharacterized protein n=1 Tax=Melghirimyces thermohalophilus TaxID=1236220 RepID=A0A1G6RHD1_9BACL|nr:hypothetical protein [Melghirimyces thermohalophilus]MDA8353929.1 hypothetical protein [Bacillota bacterium]SDD03405.1 hypothetical protein SAMN04488112_12816 [Melghirimyces thermohalophilus]